MIRIQLFLSVFVIYFLFTLMLILKNKRVLGAPILCISKEAKKTDFYKNFISFIGVSAIIVFYFLEYTELKDTLDYVGIIVLALLYCSVFVLLLRPMIPIGVYEKGVLTFSGAILFDRIGSIETAQKNDNIYIIKINLTSKYVKQHFVYVSKTEKKDVEKLIKKGYK